MADINIKGLFAKKAPRQTGMRPASTIEELCGNIVRTFSSCDPQEIVGDDYTKVMTFLLDRNLFDVAEEVSSRISPVDRPDLESLKSGMVFARAERMFAYGDLPSVKAMLSHPLLSYSLITSGRDLVPPIQGFVRPRAATPEDVAAVTDQLRDMLPRDRYYAGALDSVCSSLSAEKAGVTVPAPAPVQAADPVPEPVPVPVPAPAPRASTSSGFIDPGDRTTTVRVNRMDVTLLGEPFALGWKYKLYRAQCSDNRTTYAFRTLAEIDPYKPQPSGIPSGLASMVAEEYLWFQLTDKYPNAFINLLETCDYPFRGQLVELADRSFARCDGMTDAEKVSAVISMLRSLQCMHNEGYVHNDVKPQNLLFADGRWKLFGFDAAFNTGSSTVNANGIPEYMAPEQLRGGDIVETSDVWGAAVVLYQAMTGMLPFEGRGEMYRSNAENCRFRPGNLDPRLVPVLQRVFVADTYARPAASQLADELSQIQF